MREKIKEYIIELEKEIDRCEKELNENVGTNDKEKLICIESRVKTLIDVKGDLESRLEENRLENPTKKTHIEITVERTQRVSLEFEAIEEQIERLKCGDNLFYDEFIPYLDKEIPEYDYAVYDLDNGMQIVDWK